MVEGRGESPAMTSLELFYILLTWGIEKGSFTFTKEKCISFYIARKRCNSHGQNLLPNILLALL